MKPASLSAPLRLVALAIACALAAPTSGCSWIALRGYNDAPPGAYAEDIRCPTEYGAPVLDGVGAAGLLSVGIATLATRGSEPLDTLGKISVGFAFGLASMFIASLTTGAVWWSRCRARKRAAPRTPLSPSETRSTTSP